MSLWESLILGIVQGATEFLPVSSSGHLVIVQNLLAVNIEGVAFEVAVHLATLVSIDRESLEYAGLIIVATIPAGLLGVFAKDRIEALFDNPFVPGAALLVTGAILWSSRSTLERANDERPTWRAALLIGIAQAFALIPGISRSGSTVVAAMWLGLEAREAAAFSFLMAVPAIAGAAVLQIPDLAGAGPEGLSTSMLLVGGVAAGLTGVLAIRTFVAMLARRSFHFFAPYCWVVGALYLAFVTLR